MWMLMRVHKLPTWVHLKKSDLGYDSYKLQCCLFLTWSQLYLIMEVNCYSWHKNWTNRINAFSHSISWKAWLMCSKQRSFISHFLLPSAENDSSILWNLCIILMRNRHLSRSVLALWKQNHIFNIQSTKVLTSKHRYIYFAVFSIAVY